MLFLPLSSPMDDSDIAKIPILRFGSSGNIPDTPVSLGHATTDLTRRYIWLNAEL